MHKFDPAHIDRLLRPEREQELNPLRLLREAGLKEGDVFADIGCGPGFFTFPASGIVGDTGRVWALDAQEEMLSGLRRRNPPSNVTPLKCPETTIPLPDSSVDFALLAYMLHETGDRPGYIAEVMRVLKPTGILLILDWKKKKEDKGPPVEERLSEEFVLNLVKEAGFSRVKAASLTDSHYSVSSVKGGGSHGGKG